MNGNSAQSIPLLWQKFAPFIGTTPHQLGRNCFGLCAPSDASQNHFYYLAGVEVSDFDKLPPALSPVILPSQRYAVFPHESHVSRIKETIDAAFDQWLPNSGYNHAKQSLHFFERYSESYDPETGYGGTEIWLPVSKSSQ
ncbi:MAG TPA: GyrI-like domain-containing protein [Cellvibrio sp.]|nr:GyrI-like domain-containing protein [Cellvibrio sp.]